MYSEPSKQATITANGKIIQCVSLSPKTKSQFNVGREMHQLILIISDANTNVISSPMKAKV